MWWLPAALAQTVPGQDVHPWDVIRVDDPEAPGALARSHLSSVTLEPPDDLPWQIESVPYVDQVGDWMAWEAVDAMDVQPWHDAGFEGQGVRVAVFDLQWYGTEMETDELGDWDSWDCWAHEACTPEIDTLRPRFAYEHGSHGLACAEVIRDLAPQVELHLVRVNGITTFQNAVEWAIRNEIDVVSLSMSFMNASFYDGSGASGAAVERLTEGGVLLVTSAGNYARGHYYAPSFNDTDGDGDHDFAPGQDRLEVFLRAGKKRGLAVHWDNYSRCGDTDLDLVLYSDDGTVLDRATNTQDPDANSCSPVERLAPTLDRDQWTQLQVVRKAGDPVVPWNLITSSGSVRDAMAWGSVTDPGTHPLAWTVGAVGSVGYLGNGVEGFSSAGPTLGGDPKPDIVAPDGLTTSVYGPTGFYGTSAAAPAAAAAIALVMSRDPSLTARDAASQLESWAWSESTTWQAADTTYGAGHLTLRNPEPTGCGGSAWAGLLLLPMLGRRRCS